LSERPGRYKNLLVSQIIFIYFEAIITVHTSVEQRAFRGCSFMNEIKLWFATPEDPQLERVEFSSRFSSDPLVAVRGRFPDDRSQSSFQWSSAVKALSYLFVQSAQNPEFVLTGSTGSLAVSLDYALAKQPAWLVDMFGSDSAGSPVLRKMLNIRGSGAKKGRPVSISLAKKYSQSIRIYLSSEEIRNKEVIALLGAALSSSAVPQEVSSANELQVLSQEDSFTDQLTLIPNVNSAHDALYALLEEEKKLEQPLKVDNLAICMETTWPRFKYDLLESARFPGLEIRSLLVSESNNFTSEWTEGHWNQRAGVAIRDSLLYLERYSDRLAAAGIQVDLRTYDQMPVIHGFLVNDRRLLFSSTYFEDSILHAGNGAYLLFDPDHTNPHVYQTFVRIFKGWFDFLWQQSNPVKVREPLRLASPAKT